MLTICLLSVAKKLSAFDDNFVQFSEKISTKLILCGSLIF